jgi:hypothetical protein
MRYLGNSVDRFDYRWAAKQARDVVIDSCSVPRFAPVRGAVGFGSHMLASSQVRIVRLRIGPLTGVTASK